MIVISLEGADGTGKSTAFQGWTAGDKWNLGLVDRLSRKWPVLPSREPGSIDLVEHATPSWKMTTPMSIESHLDVPRFWMAMARYQMNIYPEATQKGTPMHAASLAVLTAALMSEHGMCAAPPMLKDVLLSAGEADWPKCFEGETRALVAHHEAYYDFVEGDPSLRQAFQSYNARDCLRHAILSTRGSSTLSPTTSGLLFFANHIVHSAFLDEIRAGTSEDLVVVTDRAAESQFAYGRARGDGPFIKELYEAFPGFTPDLVLLFTCELETLNARCADRERSDEKGWDGDAYRAAVQSSYKVIQEEHPAPWFEIDTTSASREETVAACFEIAESFLEDEALCT